MSRRVGVGLALVLSGLVLVGCDPGGSPAAGGSSPAASATSGTPNPSDLLDRAVRASKAATSVHVRGTGPDHGERVTVDVRIAAGHRAVGHIWVNRQRIDVIRIRSVLYVSGNARFWRASTGQHDVSRFTGMYMKSSMHDDDNADLRSLVNVGALLADVARPTGHLASRARTTFHGVPAIPLVDEGGGTLYVAATGTPYVLGLRDHDQRLDFTGYGKRFAVKAPPANRILPP